MKAGTGTHICLISVIFLNLYFLLFFSIFYHLFNTGKLVLCEVSTLSAATDSAGVKSHNVRKKICH